uniref:COX assembly mitochondrial protein n=1 Tax=Glossina brevipalpis TaxID=37001 RepID=A0A1A9W5G4_9MUSC
MSLLRSKAINKKQILFITIAWSDMSDLLKRSTMRIDINSNLDIPNCNQMINDLKKCHEENKFMKFFGVCNTFSLAVAKCLQEEHIARSAANRAKSRQRQEDLKRKASQAF